MTGRTRGMGGVFLRGNKWWIRYSIRGKKLRESSKSKRRSDAIKLLMRRLRDGSEGKLVGPRADKVTLGQLTAMLLDDYKMNGLRSLARVKIACNHLKDFFGSQMLAINLSTDRITSYKVSRQEAGAANATINRELAALKRAFQMALKADQLSRMPHITMLAENNARQGFLDHAEFAALKEALPERLRDPISFLYLSGWRVGEMTTLEWRDVDLTGRAVRLPPAKSKNKEGRVLPLTGRLAEIIVRAADNRRLDSPFVFHNGGSQILDFRVAWNTARTKAGLGTLLVHDLRRSAVRNLVRAGVPERTAMAITGHKTRAVFDRYNIVSESDLTDAIERRDTYLGAKPAQRKVVAIGSAR